jgi:hypothetical protein
MKKNICVCVFVIIYSFANSQSLLLPYNDGKKWGYIKENGNVIITPKYDEAYLFQEDVASALFEGKFGFIDRNGNFVIKPEFERTSGFEGGVAMVEKNHRNYYINKKGKILVEADSLGVFPGYGDSLIDFRQGEKVGFLNLDSQIVISPKYENVYSFAEKHAAVKLNGKWCLINRTDSLCYCTNYQYLSSPSNGISVFSIDTLINGLITKYGFISTKGKVSYGLHDFAYAFIGNITLVKDGLKWKAVHKNGMIIELPIGEPTDFFEKGVVMKANDKYGIYNFETKSYAAKLQYEDIRGWVGSQAVYKKDGRYGVIDVSGRIILNALYDELFIIKENLFMGFLNGTSTEYYNSFEDHNPVIMVYIDGNGKIIWKSK